MGKENRVVNSEQPKLGDLAILLLEAVFKMIIKQNRLAKSLRFGKYSANGSLLNTAG